MRTPLPFRRTRLALAVGLAAIQPTQAAEWQCRQDRSGDWVCRAERPTPPALEPTPVAPPVTTPTEAPVTEPSNATAPIPAVDTPATDQPTVAPVETGTLPADEAAAPTPPSTETRLTPLRRAPERPVWDLCPPWPAREITFFADPQQTGPTQLSADRAESRGNEVYQLDGNAVVREPQQQLSADHILYDGFKGTVDAEGSVRLDEPNLRMTADKAHVLTETQEGTIENADFLLYLAHARGASPTVFLEGPNRKRLLDATYTTCAYDSDTWRLRGSEVTLKQDKGEGVARHARLEVHNVPVFYTPYITFPIDDRRKSGLLTPSYGNSDESGLDVRVPYYWNIAPHRDATITPRHMEKRGLMLDSEFRYLNLTNEGELDFTFLPSDDAFGQDRHLVGYQHEGTLGERVRIEADLKDVSDQDYFEDFGDVLNLTSTTHLERRLDGTYRGDWWSLTGRLQHYQTVDSDIAAASRPYERLPQISLRARPDWNHFGLEYDLQAEATAFDHSRNKLVDTGNRYDLTPKVSLPLRRSAYEITPALSLRHTQYDLDRVDMTKDDAPSRTAPIFSLDNKLFLERNTGLLGGQYLQTLEPRAFYLYAADRDHSDIPVFDSANRTFRFSELFSENRFSGGDRVGDANQLALAVTTRYLDPVSGTEKLRASVGELFYFRDREVTLRGGDPDTDSRSEYAGELAVNLTSRWSLSADALWDPQEEITTKSNTSLSYRGGRRKLANLSYRSTRPTLEQVDASWLWPLSPAWHMVGRWNYDLEDNRTLEGIAGLEYQSCCWAARIAWQKVLNDADKEKSNYALYMELELKGLTSIGDKVESVLQDGILGYRSEWQ